MDVTDETALAYALEENLRRKALPDETTAVAQLLQIYAKTNPSKRGGDRRSRAFSAGQVQSGHRDRENATERVAHVVGQSVREVRRKGRIGRLGTPKVKQALAGKQIKLVEAEKLAGLSPRDQERQLDALLRDKNRSDVPKDIRKAVDALSYVEKVLGRYGRGALSREQVDDLSQRAAGVVGLLGRLGGSSRGSASRHAARQDSSARPPSNSCVEGAVRFEPVSQNRKLSEVGLAGGRKRPHFTPLPPYVCSTLVSIQASCPDSCAFKGSPGSPGGCYVYQGSPSLIAPGSAKVIATAASSAWAP